MLTKRVKYALKALVFVHKNQGKNLLSAKKIAEEEGIPFKFLENILLELKKATLVKNVQDILCSLKQEPA